MHGEAERLIEASFGEVLLHIIGRCYSSAAEMYLGNFLEAGFAHLKQKGCEILGEVTLMCTISCALSLQGRFPIRQLCTQQGTLE